MRRLYACSGRARAAILWPAQCCEHLNRAVVLERAAAEKYGYEPVCAVPWLHGGGFFVFAREVWRGSEAGPGPTSGASGDYCPGLPRANLTRGEKGSRRQRPPCGLESAYSTGQIMLESRRLLLPPHTTDAGSAHMPADPGELASRFALFFRPSYPANVKTPASATWPAPPGFWVGFTSASVSSNVLISSSLEVSTAID